VYVRVRPAGCKLVCTITCRRQAYHSHWPVTFARFRIDLRKKLTTDSLFISDRTMHFWRFVSHLET